MSRQWRTPPDLFRPWQRAEFAVLVVLTGVSLALHVAFGTGGPGLLLLDLALLVLLVHTATWMVPLLRDSRQDPGS